MATLLTTKPIKQRGATAPRSSHRSWWLIISETIVYLAVFAALLETYFYIAGIGQQEFLQPDPELGLKHIPNKLVTWRMEGYSSEKINSDGLRDTEHSLQKPAGVYRIALLGDSATEGLQVALKDTYGKVLERMLNSQVTNLARRTSWERRPPAEIAGACNAPLQLPTSASPKQGCSATPWERRLPAGIKGAHGAPATSDISAGRSGAEQAIQRFEVINFGCSSYSTGQQLLQYRQQVLKYQPDAIVLLYNRGDSLENVIKPGANLSSLEPRPYFYLDNSGALHLEKSILQSNQDKLHSNPVLDFFRSNSRIYGVFTQAHLSLSMNDSRYRKLVSWFRSFSERGLPAGFEGAHGAPLPNSLQTDSATKGACNAPLKEPIPGSPAQDGSNTSWERRHPAGFTGACNAPAPMTPPQDPLRVTLALVHTLATEAKAHHQSFIFMMFPNTIGDPDVDRQQTQLKKLAKKDGFDFIDLLPPFQNADPDADFIQIHFSPIGHRRVATALYNLLHDSSFTSCVWTE
jgi:hypothetical protein